MSSVATEDEGTPCECLAIYNTVMTFKDHLQNVFVDKGLTVASKMLADTEMLHIDSDTISYDTRQLSRSVHFVLGMIASVISDVIIGGGGYRSVEPGHTSVSLPSSPRQPNPEPCTSLSEPQETLQKNGGMVVVVSCPGGPRMAEVQLTSTAAARVSTSEAGSTPQAAGTDHNTAPTTSGSSSAAVMTTSRGLSGAATSPSCGRISGPAATSSRDSSGTVTASSCSRTGDVGALSGGNYQAPTTLNHRGARRTAASTCKRNGPHAPCPERTTEDVAVSSYGHGTQQTSTSWTESQELPSSASRSTVDGDDDIDHVWGNQGGGDNSDGDSDPRGFSSPPSGACKDRLLRKVYEYKCGICSESFTKGGRAKHLREVHNVDEPFRQNFTCQMCQEVFSRSGLLKKHRNAVHRFNQRVNGKYPCGMCSELFATKPDRTAHRKDVHNFVSKVFKCPQCPEEFTSCTDRLKHLKDVHKQSRFTRVYKCGLCTREFSTQKECTRHRKTAHDFATKLFKCGMCAEVFTSCTDRQKHRKMVHRSHKSLPEQETSRYVQQVSFLACSFCEKTFASDASCRQHMEKEHSSSDKVCTASVKSTTEQSVQLKNCTVKVEQGSESFATQHSGDSKLGSRQARTLATDLQELHEDRSDDDVSHHGVGDDPASAPATRDCSASILGGIRDRIMNSGRDHDLVTVVTDTGTSVPNSCNETDKHSRQRIRMKSWSVTTEPRPQWSVTENKEERPSEEKPAETMASLVQDFQIPADGLSEGYVDDTPVYGVTTGVFDHQARLAQGNSLHGRASTDRRHPETNPPDSNHLTPQPTSGETVKQALENDNEKATGDSIKISSENITDEHNTRRHFPADKSGQVGETERDEEACLDDALEFEESDNDPDYYPTTDFETKTSWKKKRSDTVVHFSRSGAESRSKGSGKAGKLNKPQATSSRRKATPITARSRRNVREISGESSLVSAEQADLNRLQRKGGGEPGLAEADFEKCADERHLGSGQSESPSDSNVEAKEESQNSTTGRTRRGSKSASFLCTVCAEAFHSARDRSKHLRDVHDISGPGSNTSKKRLCSLCGQEFGSKQALKNHVTGYHYGTAAQLVTYACPMCELQFVGRLRADYHLKTVHNVSVSTTTGDVKGGVDKFRCDFCSEEFPTDSGRSQHLETAHKVDKAVLLTNKINAVDPRLCFKFGCDFCPESFAALHQREEHLRSALCRTERSSAASGSQLQFIIRCRYCGVIFKTRVGRNHHEKTVHADEERPKWEGRAPDWVKPFECHLCGALKRTRQQLDWHLHTHTGEPGFVCHQCGKSFPHKSTMYRHLNVHRPDLFFACPLCPAKYKDKRGLKAHTRRHHHHHDGSQPAARAESAQCPLCGKRFSSSSNLRYHTYAHTGEKPYACAKCGAAFASPSALGRHRKRHSSQRPHKCGVCQRAFKLKQTLTDHMSTHAARAGFQCRVCGAKFKQDRSHRIHMKRHEKRNETGKAVAFVA